MTIEQEVLDALPETGGNGRHLPALALFSKPNDPVDVEGADGRRYMIGWAGGIRYKRALPAYWPRLGAEHAVAIRTRDREPDFHHVTTHVCDTIKRRLKHQGSRGCRASSASAY